MNKTYNMFEAVLRQKLPNATVIEREVLCIPGRKYRADFYLPKIRLAIEIEGGIWSTQKRGGSRWASGAHSHPLSILRDIEKGNLYALHGLWVLRFTPEKLPPRSMEAVQTVVTFLRVRQQEQEPVAILASLSSSAPI